MNKSYRLVWNETTNTWAAVAENVKSRGKRASGAVLLAAAGILLPPVASALAAPPNPPAATALPSGGQIVAGSTSIGQSGATMTINQSTDRAAINWNTFNVGSGATVNFVQPSASSVALNRVSDPNPSQIFGHINANGSVLLLNGSGAYFAPGSSVNVGAFLATTHSISDADFMAGNNHFTRNGAPGAIINEGDINAALGGYVALLAPEVRNHGVIVAQLGTVALAAGEAFDLQFNGSTLTNVRVLPATIAALVENGNAVHAPGGLIILSAKAANSLQGGIVNNSGSLEANGLTNNGGVIRLEASDTINQSGSINVDAAANSTGNGGTATVIASLANANSTTNFSGSISARGGSLGGNGGFVETSASNLHIANGVRIDTRAPSGKNGQWLLDPINITIAATGGDIAGATIATALQTTDVTLDTSGTGTCTGATCGVLAGTAGDITLNDNITVTGGSVNTTLTLKATNSILMNAGKSINASGNGASKVNVVFWADSDATGGGSIWLKAAAGVGSSIITNGGNITLSGGTNVTTGYAQGTTTVNGNGVLIDAATLNSGGGNIVIRGKSAATGTSYVSTDFTASIAGGILLSGSNTINAGTGTIDMQGMAMSSSGASNGICTNNTGYTKILSSAINTTAINLLGDARGATSGSGNWGTFLWGGSTFGIVLAATGTGGGITLNGYGANLSVGGGTHLEPNAFVLAASGPISISGTKGTGSSWEDVVINSTVGFVSALPAGLGTTSPVTASTSSISISADTLNPGHVLGSAPSSSAVQSSGALVILPRTAGQALAVQSANPGAGVSWVNPSSMFTGASGIFKPGFSKVTFGSSTTGSVTLNNYTLDNPTDINTSGNAILGAISIANNALTVNMTGSGTITNTGAVAVSKLALNGSTSAATLTNTGNAIGTLAATVASLSLVNSSALTVGTVGALNGITATGAIDIATLSGDLTVSQNLTTTDATTAALLLNAGKSTVVGTTTGGNIVLSGSPTISVGAGGRSIFMTGAIANAALTTLIGSGSGNFRYNSDETSAATIAALGTSGKFAFYREQPTIFVTPGSASSTYGNTVGLGSLTWTLAFANGDTNIGGTTSGTASFTTTATNSSHVGSYNIAYASGFSNSLGYGFADATGSIGEYSITTRILTTTLSNTGVTKTYDGTTAAPTGFTPTYTVTGYATGDSGATLTNTGSAYNSVNAASASVITVSGLALSGITGSGLTSDYALDATSKTVVATITAVAGTTTTTTPVTTTPVTTQPVTTQPVTITTTVTTTPVTTTQPVLIPQTTPASSSPILLASLNPSSVSAMTGGLVPTTMTDVPETSQGGTGLTFLSAGSGGNSLTVGETKIDSTVTSTVKVATKAPVATITPVATTGAESVVTSPGVIVKLAQIGTSAQTGAVSVEVPKNTASAGGFSFGLPAEVVGDKAVTVNSAGGAPLPKWLKFDPSSKSFIATKVPEGGLPLTVEVNVAGAKTSIVISNTAEDQ